MNIFICTFFIKLNSVRVKQNKRQGKRFSTSLTANIKSANQQVLAISTKKPVVINGTAWFSEQFQIKSDIVYDQITKKGKQSIVILEVIREFQSIRTYHKMPINLTEVHEKKKIQERMYKLDGGGGVQASLELSCFQNINETVIIGKLNNRPKRLISRMDSSKSLQQDIKNTGQFYKVPQLIGRNTPSFGMSQSDPQSNMNFKQMQIIYQTHLAKIHSQESHQFFQIEQMKKLQAELLQQKQKNRRCKQKIDSFAKTQINNTAKIQTLLSQLHEAEQLVAQLSANISSHQTEIVELKLQLEDVFNENAKKQSEGKQQKDSFETLRKNHQNQAKKLHEDLGELRKKYEESQHMLEIYKFQLNKNIHLLNEQTLIIEKQQKQKQNFVKQFKNYKQNITTLNNQILHLKQAISQSQKQNENIRREAKAWRGEFATEQKRKYEQYLALQQKYQELCERYGQMIKQDSYNQRWISKDLYYHEVQFYEEKFSQYEQKQETLRKQITIIEDEMSNTYEILEEKEERQQLLIQHIRKLQEELEDLKRERSFWQNVMPKEFNLEKSSDGQTNGYSQEIAKLQQKNSQLLKMLKAYSKGILETQKLGRQLQLARKKCADSIQKVDSFKEQLKQLKERIAVLMKQNKKLLDKNHIITKHSQLQDKKCKRIEDQLKILGNQSKDMKKDYDIMASLIKNIKKEPITNHHQTKAKSFNKNIKTNLHRHEHDQPSSKLSKHSSLQSLSIHQNSELYMQNLTKLLQQRKVENDKLNKHINKHLQETYNQKKLNMQKELKSIHLLMNKMKTKMVKSGDQNIVADLQLCVKRIASQFQNLIIKI